MMDDFGNSVPASKNSREMIWKMIYFFYAAVPGNAHIIAADNPY